MTIANTLYVPSNDFIVEAFHVDGGPLPLNGKWLTIVRMGFTGHFVYDLRSNKYRKKSESRKTFGAALASLHDAEKLENSLVTGMRMSGFVAGPPVAVRVNLFETISSSI